MMATKKVFRQVRKPKSNQPGRTWGRASRDLKRQGEIGHDWELGRRLGRSLFNASTCRPDPVLNLGFPSRPGGKFKEKEVGLIIGHRSHGSQVDLKGCARENGRGNNSCPVPDG